ncbi:type IX secretion system membrane protein PorP/SprF [Chitinophaga sp. sic0106]|uniref:PorP/SprF family type IX secretion system membrane protein n=1 Tax=Chitinophaga sp. sic0106 TaxID=2854785 RepID=UPI001C478088|nr:type IX secretion system membrane protein PorP/SprF [Chitinophaga sp. sic0106]MBV7530654.1 type IX secretion system membrane protein PorP/SprF [Chitinophaga sp. sic0106]
MKKNLLVLLFCLVCEQAANAQQDAQLSQYIFSGLYINPAYAGYREMWNVNAFYRNQWSGFPGGPKSVALAIDGVAREGRYGLGLNMSNDEIGLQGTSTLYASYAFRIPIGHYEEDKRLSVGVSAGFIQSRIKVEAYDPTDPVDSDPTLYNSLRSKFTPDARFGVFYSSNTFYAGLSVDNLLTAAYDARKDPGNIFAERKVHMYATIGGMFTLSENLQIKPGLLVKEDFAGPTSLDVNAFVILKQMFWIGAGYRTAILNKPRIQDDLNKSGAIIGIAQVFIGEKFRIGYAYEYTTNVVGMGSYPTNELSVSYFFPTIRTRAISPRYF